jgi:hypothetical protein
MKICTRKTTGLQRIALSCCLISVPRLCVAQTMDSAVASPDAPAIAWALSPNSPELPSAPEPSDQVAQPGGAPQNQANQPNQQDQTKPPNAPSMGDLGFTPQQMQANAQIQAMLEKRTHMLKVHQTLGLITAIPMAATLITGPQAKAKGKNGQTITESTAANLDFHIALGGLTTGPYWTTVYYSIFAPKVPGVQSKGAIRLHRDLEWVRSPRGTLPISDRPLAGGTMPGRIKLPIPNHPIRLRSNGTTQRHLRCHLSHTGISRVTLCEPRTSRRRMPRCSRISRSKSSLP